MNAKQLQAANMPPSWAGMVNDSPSWAPYAEQQQQPAWSSSVNPPIDLKAIIQMVVVGALCLFAWRRFA